MITFGRGSVLIDGEPSFIFSGESQNYRLPPGAWQDRLEKMKALGMNCTGTYFGWNFHCPDSPQADFTAPGKDVGRFLDLAQQAGLYVIARPGPYVCNEWDLGGFPGWLLAHAESGDWRTHDRKHLDFCREWYRQIDAVLAPRQHEQGGPVILYQVENEHFWGEGQLLDGLAEAARADGITVPLIGNNGGGSNRAGSRYLVDGADIYTNVWELWRWRGWVNMLRGLLPPEVPLMIPEYRSGNHPFWGEELYEENMYPSDWCLAFTRMLVGCGANMINPFVTAGGITPVGFGSDHICTAYGEDAPISHWGGLGRKFRLLRQFTLPTASFSRQLSLAPVWPLGWGTDNPHIEALARKGDDGAFFVPVNPTGTGQRFRLALPDGKFLPPAGRDPLFLPARSSAFFAAGVHLDGGVKLLFSSAQPLHCSLAGDTLTCVVFGQPGETGYLEAARGGETLCAEFTCRDGVDRQRVSGNGWTLDVFAITQQQAGYTWLVAQKDGRILPVFGNLSLLRHAAAGEPLRAEHPAGEPLQLLIPDKTAARLNGKSIAGATRKDGLCVIEALLPAPGAACFTARPALAAAEDEGWLSAPAASFADGADWQPVRLGENGRDPITQTGYYEFRATFDCTGELPEYLEFPGLSSGEMVFYLNGVKLGVFPPERPRTYHELPALSAVFPVRGIVRAGENTLCLTCDVIGRHNQGRAIFSGMTLPPILYTRRAYVPVSGWKERPAEFRQWFSGDLITAPDFSARGYDDTGWRALDLPVPGSAAQKGDAALNQTACPTARGTDLSEWLNMRWYRTTFRLESGLRHRPLFLQFPRTDDVWLYVNGIPAGHLYTDQSKVFDLTAFSGEEELTLTFGVRYSWKPEWELLEAPVFFTAAQVLGDGWQRRRGSAGERENRAEGRGEWGVPAQVASARRIWYKQEIAYSKPDGLVAPAYLELDEGWRTNATIYWNGVPVGMYAQVGPDRRFYLPQEMLQPENLLVIAVDGYSAPATMGGVHFGVYEEKIPFTLELV